MADTKISALTSATPVGTDEIVIVDDPGGTPSSKRATVRSAIQTDILSGAGAPATTPDYVGQRYVDTTADELYVATDTASSADWDKMFSAANSTAYTTSGNTTVVASVSGSLTLDYVPKVDGSGNIIDGKVIPSGAFVGDTDTQVLTNKTLTAPQINDTSADHQYVFAVSELAADRTVTLPLLTGNDTFVFNDHTATLTNKTLTSPVLSGTITGTYTIGGTPTFPGVLGDLDTLGAPTTDGEFIVATGAGAFAYESGATARTSMGAAALGANTFTGTQDFNGQQVEGYLNKVVSSVTGALTAADHSGNILVTSGNVTVPTTAGFTCTLIAGGAHTVTFNATTSAAMAAGDVMTVIVESSTVIHAVLTASADKVSFT